MCAVFSFNTFAQGYTKGEGRFYAKDDDSLTFIKKQLLVSAFRNILTKELEGMKLDPNLFWQAYDAKFEEYFAPTLEKLKAKYGIYDDSTVKVPAKRMEAYQNELRLKRLNLKSAYGRLSQAIKSYVINKMTRSTQMPNSRYIDLQAKVDKALLGDIYTRFTQKAEIRHFKKLYFSPNFVLSNLTWTDLGVKLEADFTEVLKEHWRNWLEENLRAYVDEIIFTDQATYQKLRSYAKIPLQAIDAIHNLVDEKNTTLEVGNSSSTELVDIEDAMKNSLWLDLKVKIKKGGEDDLLKMKTFEFTGDYALVDLKMNKLVSFYDFIKETSTISYESLHALSSNAASLVYRLPLGKLQEVPKILNDIPVGMKRMMIDVNNISSLTDVMSLQNFLTEKGLLYKFNPMLLNISSTKAKLALNYKGDNEDVKKLLLGFNRSKIGNGKFISFPSGEAPFTFNLEKKQKLQEEDIEKIKKKHRLGKEKENV